MQLVGIAKAVLWQQLVLLWLSGTDSEQISLRVEVSVYLLLTQ